MGQGRDERKGGGEGGGGSSNLHTKLTSSGPGINQAKISATRITDPQLGIPTGPFHQDFDSGS